MNTKNIFLIRDGQQVTTFGTQADTVGGLADELDISDYSAAVNQAQATSETTIVQGDVVALITRDKTGGAGRNFKLVTSKTTKKLGRPSKEDFQAGGFHLSKSELAKLKAVAAFEGKTMDQYASEVMHNHIQKVNIRVTKRS